MFPRIFAPLVVLADSILKEIAEIPIFLIRHSKLSTRDSISCPIDRFISFVDGSVDASKGRRTHQRGVEKIRTYAARFNLAFQADIKADFPEFHSRRVAFNAKLHAQEYMGSFREIRENGILTPASLQLSYPVPLRESQTASKTRPLPCWQRIR